MECRFSRQTPVNTMTTTRDPTQPQFTTAKTHTLDLPTVDHCFLLSLQIFQPF